MQTPPMLTLISPPGSPAPVGPYSPAVIAGNLVFVSGQSGRDPVTEAVSPDIEAQTERALMNVAAILEGAGSGLANVIRCGVFLADMNDFGRMNAVYARIFGAHRPARTTVEVTGLPGPDLRVEIDAIALLK